MRIFFRYVVPLIVIMMMLKVIYSEVAVVNLVTAGVLLASLANINIIIRWIIFVVVNGYLISSIFLYNVFGEGWNRSFLTTVLLTDDIEAREFGSSYIFTENNMLVMIISVVVLCAVWRYGVRYGDKIGKKVETRYKVSSKWYYKYAFLVVLIIFIVSIDRYAVVSLNVTSQSIISIIKTNVSRKIVLERLEKNENKIKIKDSGKDQVHIIVLGESLSRSYMGVYGYGRNNTPNFARLNKKGDLIKFNNIVTLIPSTEIATRHIFSFYHLNRESFLNSPDLFTYLNKAGYKI